MSTSVKAILIMGVAHQAKASAVVATQLSKAGVRLAAVLDTDRSK